MLQNAYLLAKIGADTAENEQHFAEILPKIDNYPTCPLPYGPPGTAVSIGHVPTVPWARALAVRLGSGVLRRGLR